jgi:Zn-dependent oligopeptidase
MHQAWPEVHPDETLRAAGDECERLLTTLATDMSLSRPVYDAVSRIDSGDADEAMQFSLQKLLLSFRLSGVDKDEAARNRIRELSNEIAAIGQEFDRNIREDTRYLELSQRRRKNSHFHTVSGRIPFLRIRGQRRSAEGNAGVVRQAGLSAK